MGQLVPLRHGRRFDDEFPGGAHVKHSKAGLLQVESS
jgi:hypothetical protein